MALTFSIPLQTLVWIVMATQSNSRLAWVVMIVSTTDSIPNRTITEHCGVVTGNTVRAKHFGRDIAAGLKTLIGGEIRGYTEMLAEARKQASQRMIEEAQQLNADAVINVRFTTSMVMQGMSEMLAYGTAVKTRE